MKKLFSKGKIAFLLAMTIALTTVLSGCGSLLGATITQGFRGTRTVTLSSKKLDMYAEMTIDCDFRDYFVSNFDFTKEDQRLKKFCFISVMDAHDVGVASFNTSPNTDETNNKKFLTEMGFYDIVECEVGSDATVDKNDTVGMVISKKYVGRIGQYPQYILNVSLCGTQGSAEWQSNFDFGSSTSDYTGSHPDWTNKNNHKGFDVTANRVIDAINDYLHRDPSLVKGKTVLLISGYSHGAAIANLVGAKIADDKNEIHIINYQAVTYAFATPRTTYDPDRSICSLAKYNNIHNYFNEDDVVPNLPTESMGFARYGQEHTYTIQNNADNLAAFNSQVDLIKARDAANGITSSATYYDASCSTTIITALNNLLTDRNAVYTIIEDEAHKTYHLGTDGEYTTAEAAEQAGKDFLKEMELRGVDQFFKDAGVTKKTHEVEIIDEGTLYLVPQDYYVWDCYVGDGVLVEVFNNMISNALQGNLSEALNNRYLITYSKHSTNFNTIVNKLIWNPSYFANAHNPLACYIGCMR